MPAGPNIACERDSRHRTLERPPVEAGLVGLRTQQRSSLRRAAVVALFAGAAWIAVGLDTIVRPDVYTYRDVLILIPWLTTGAALVQLQRVQASRAGRLGKVGIWMVVAAIA